MTLTFIRGLSAYMEEMGVDARMNQEQLAHFFSTDNSINNNGESRKSYRE